MTALLEINDLAVRYRSGRLFDRLRRSSDTVTVLPGASLSVAAGETVGLIGESGSGKTTLGRAVVGLSPIASGTITLDGTVADRRSRLGTWRRLRRNVGLMFQDPAAALDPRMTLGNSITEPLAIHDRRGLDRRKRARQLLLQVGLPAEFADRYPHQISGGQARRVTVARALALRPQLVVADEPTAGLDVSIQGELLNLLNSLQKELGLSFLLITHNLAVARHVTDRIAIMYLGRIVETGRTADIFARPSHPYTRALLQVREPGRSRQPLKGEVPSLRHRPDGCEFHTRCPLAQDICRTQRPADRLLGREHFAACHFAETVASVDAPAIPPSSPNAIPLETHP